MAFILAFLFRTFDAEAFVIPTGSMATTLMGEHKDLLCPECGYRYRAGASSESEDLAAQRGLQGPPPEIVDVTCPLCRYTASVDPRTAEGRTHPTYGGDRILVTKFTYDFTDPKRWDVVVFKYPLQAQTNYIKRLVGLPRESLMIFHGDLHVKPEGAAEFSVARRGPEKIVVMAPIVYDNDYVVDAMTKKGWPLRWQEHAAGASDEGGWKSPDGGRSFEIDGSAGGERWLGYRHFVPSLNDWRMMEKGSLPERYHPRPQLITDFVAYDTSVPRGQSLLQPLLAGWHWVGDLLLECELDVKEGQGTTAVELVRAGRHFRCQFDCATGGAQLSIDGQVEFKPKATTSVRGRGRHRVRFANVDRQLLLWVDGAVVAFDAPTTYEESPESDYPRSSADDPGDLEPARIGSHGCPLAVRQIRLSRDVYYIAAREGAVVDYPSDSIMRQMGYRDLVHFWSSPEAWHPAGRPSPFEERRQVTFELAKDQYFMLGDNSPMSLDARLWDDHKYVERDLLIGKALCIFWPHSFNHIPGTRIPFPFFPNFSRMGFIR